MQLLLLLCCAQSRYFRLSSFEVIHLFKHSISLFQYLRIINRNSKKMFSAISSYLFGDDATEIEVNDAVVCDEESTVDDWILVDHVSIDGKSSSFHLTRYYSDSYGALVWAVMQRTYSNARPQ